MLTLIYFIQIIILLHAIFYQYYTKSLVLYHELSLIFICHVSNTRGNGSVHCQENLFTFQLCDTTQYQNICRTNIVEAIKKLIDKKSIKKWFTWLTEPDDMKGAKPQSETCTASSSSRRTLADLKFLWIIGGSQNSCRYLHT